MNNQNKYKVQPTIIFFIALLSFGIFVVEQAFAGSVQIENNVSVNASSGGNNSGSVNEGESFTNVSAKTWVDGKLVQDFNESEQGTGTAKVKVVNIYATGTASSSVTTGLFEYGTTSVDVATEAEARGMLSQLINYLKELLAYVMG